MVTAFKNIKGRLKQKDMFCDVKIMIDSSEIYLKAIIDTGNFLKDPISKSPVIVVEKEALKGKVSEKILDNLEEIISNQNIDIGEYVPKIRLIPFSSLGKENGILTGIKVDRIKISYDGRDIYNSNVIMGVYNGKLSKTDKYKSLIGLDLLEDKGGTSDEYLGTYKRQNNDNTCQILK